MHFQQFDTPEAMQAALAEQQAHALAGLHPMQQALTAGAHWVRFVNLDTQPMVIEFGQVATPEMIVESETEGGSSLAEALDFVRLNAEKETGGFLYGRADSVLGDEGGYTHKAHAWPIEQRLFEAAQDVSWNADRLDELGRLLLEIAFRGMRAHVLRTEGR